MPVFDIAAGTRQLTGPGIMNPAYEGRAMRAKIEGLEKANELADLELAAFGDAQKREERRLAVSEGNLGVLEDQEARLQEAQEMEAQRQAAEMGRRAAKAGLDAYNAFKGTEEEKRRAGYEATIASVDNDLPGGIKEVEAYLQEQGKTIGDFDPGEAQAILAAMEKERLPKDIDPLELAEKFTNESIQEFMQTGNPASLIPRPEQGKADTAKPIPTPTRAKDEIIDQYTEELINEKYDDYGFANGKKDVIEVKRWVGNSAERIQRLYAQRNVALSFDEAAKLAVVEVDKFIHNPENPGFFRNDETTFTPPLYNIGDVIEGTDGKRYLVTGYNEQGGPSGELIDN